MCLRRIFTDSVRELVENNGDALSVRLRVLPDPLTVRYMRDVKLRVGLPGYRCPECRRWLLYAPYKVHRLIWLCDVLSSHLGDHGSDVVDDGGFAVFFP